MTVRVLLCVAGLILSAGGLQAQPSQPNPASLLLSDDLQRIYEAARRVEIAQSDVEQNRERAAWAERMVKKGYMSQAQAQAERSRMIAAELAVLKARAELKALAKPNN
ncbi:MAG TPA: hypothetical protein VKE74_31640 [Gemmataceae bacterium]|nr:hypothetical protein [Gemmataceae bacterium]